VTFWDWLDRRWPTERGWVTLGIFSLAASMLKMAEVHPALWNVELFKALLTLVIGTGIINMILAFHFAANKADETKSENTGKALDAIKSVAENSGPPPAASAARGAQQAADAAQDKADELKAPPVPEFAQFPPDEIERKD
jgi:cytoskeletal protein RodZ